MIIKFNGVYFDVELNTLEENQQNAGALSATQGNNSYLTDYIRNNQSNNENFFGDNKVYSYVHQNIALSLKTNKPFIAGGSIENYFSYLANLEFETEELKNSLLSQNSINSLYNGLFYNQIFFDITGVISKADNTNINPLIDGVDFKIDSRDIIFFTTELNAIPKISTVFVINGISYKFNKSYKIGYNIMDESTMRLYDYRQILRKI